MPEILKNEDVKILQQGSIDLLVESYSNSARVLQIRGMGKEQAISADIVTSSDRSLVSSVIDITDVPIFLTAKASVAGVKRGELYVKVFLRVDGVIVALLMAGYVHDTSNIAYPNGKIESSIEGPGLIRSITGTNPAAGVEISETVPTGAKWRLLALRVRFIPSADVATRSPMLQFDDGTAVFFLADPSQTVTASQDFGWGFGLGTERLIPTNDSKQWGVPTEIFLLAGYRFKTNTSSIQAADNWGAPQYLVEEWIEP